MNTKKFLACLLASAMMCGVLASCGDSDDDKSSEATEATTVETTTEEATEEEFGGSEETTEDSEEATEEPQAVAIDDIEFEDAVEAGSGDAYLAIVDDQWWIQYWGALDTPLTYNAGVVHIDGNGDYTVSVTADTNGFRFDTTNDVNDQYTPSGLSFLAVMIKDGETEIPGAVITVNSVTIDGNEVPMSAKAYTSSDDGVETRANLYNEWVSDLPEDARSTEGLLYGTDAAADYSAQVVDPSSFNDGWTTVEVNFTISGLE